jgi:hypothetical protein
MVIAGNGLIMGTLTEAMFAVLGIVSCLLFSMKFVSPPSP